MFFYKAFLFLLNEGSMFLPRKVVLIHEGREVAKNLFSLELQQMYPGRGEKLLVMKILWNLID